jgi:hypothetical protein
MHRVPRPLPRHCKSIEVGSRACVSLIFVPTAERAEHAPSEVAMARRRAGDLRPPIAVAGEGALADIVAGAAYSG